jgi:RecB family exonuclease
MDNTTIVLPSARAIRHEQLSLQSETLFLPNYITMSDFISKLCIVKDFKHIDDDSRVLLLLEASDFKDFSNLQIERNFFTFTKNSSYIFKFFEELSAELYDINLLSGADTYAEYEEHITILQELYKRYETLCTERKLLDRIFLPKLYEFNENYAVSHDKVSIHLEGHLTNFEFELLSRAKEFTQVELLFSATAFNTKMQSRFLDLGLELEVGYAYTISLNELTVVNKTLIKKNKSISCESFSESLLQMAFVKQKVYEFIEKGHEPQNIAVILPSEQTAVNLQSFDEKGNFNFAMGKSFVTSEIYTKLNATIKAIEQDSKENEARVERVGDELFVKFYSIYYKKSAELDFIDFLEELCELFNSKSELNIFKEEIFSFTRVLPFMKEMSIKSVMSLFMQRLAERTIDDIRGGKVTVMGVLETRAVHFDGVIIIDFDDKNVPKRSDKDMFLNTKIRENAKLPTMNDRENLQKHYYEMLMSRSKDVAISYVSSSQSSVSRFLKQLKIKEKNIHNELDYASILFQRHTKKTKEDEEIKEPYSFKDVKLSATRLKSFLSCKRKYYLKYVKNIKNHDIPKDMPEEHEIGTAVHAALKELYTKKNSYSDVEELKRDLDRELEEVCEKSELDKYLIALQKKRLEAFCEQEVERFKSGWSVVSCEENLSVEYAGMTLSGQIDRIDKRENSIEVLDYKTGSYKLYNKNNFTEATDFQLEFYYLLAAAKGNVEQCSFYDLKESKIVPEAFLGEKLEILKSHIKDLLMIEDVNFSKCEDIKNCTYCEYKIMCGRE